MRTITDRIDNITLVDDRWSHAILPAPPSVKIELTAACNYKCAYCIKSIRPDSRSMDRAFFSRIIREMRDAGVEELGVFYIGESMMCPWLADGIAEAKQEVGFPYVFLTTNGSAASEKKLRACMEAGLDSLKFSLNFSNEAQFTEIAQADPRYFRKAIEMVKVARRVRDEGGYDCGLFASSIKYNGAQAEQMQTVLGEVRPYLDEVYLLPLFSMSGASRNAGMKPTPGNPGRLGCMRPPLGCWSVFKEGHITVDGKLSACCFGTGIDDDSLTMADLKETDFMSGWNSVAFQELRRAHLRKDVAGTGCEKCVAA